MTNEELCILAQSGNADAESELIDHLLPSLKALAAKFEAQYTLVFRLKQTIFFRRDQSVC